MVRKISEIFQQVLGENVLTPKDSDKVSEKGALLPMPASSETLEGKKRSGVEFWLQKFASDPLKSLLRRSGIFSPAKPQENESIPEACSNFTLSTTSIYFPETRVYSSSSQSFYINNPN